ncbi:sulfotransferase 1C4-like [Ptychodera flava]|uniref:sulfotransferase 1C4-like n=1 Tax=Ptychodera flava TaxID=63121 RepID=UPI00396A7000
MTASEGFHYYEGVLFYDGLLPASSLDAARKLKVREDDVFVMTYPKSGTTWLQQIVSLIRNSDDISSTDEVPLTKRVPFLEVVPPGEERIPISKVLDTMESPRYIKTHLIKRLLPPDIFTVKPKVLYLARNPKDVLISFYDFKAHPWSWKEYFDNFLKGNVCFGSWFENVEYWWEHRNDDNVLFLFYEDMIRDLKGHVRKIADFLNKSLDDATLDEITRRSSFNVMKENPNANFKAPFREGMRKLNRGKPGIWKSRLTEAENEAMEKAFSGRMKEMKIEFPFYSYDDD